MDIIFTCIEAIVIGCILFGIYVLFKKQYDLAIGNFVVPLFFTFFVNFSIMQDPANEQVEIVTYFVQQLKASNPFAIFAVILFVMFVIILIWDIRTIMENRRKRKIKKTSL